MFDKRRYSLLPQRVLSTSVFATKDGDISSKGLSRQEKLWQCADTGEGQLMQNTSVISDHRHASAPRPLRRMKGEHGGWVCRISLDVESEHSTDTESQITAEECRLPKEDVLLSVLF